MTSTEALETEDIPENLCRSAALHWHEWERSMPRSAARLCSSRRWTQFSWRRPGSHALRHGLRQKAFKEVRLKAKVLKMATSGKQIKVEIEADGQTREELYDAPGGVGRVPNAADLGLKTPKSRRRQGLHQGGANQRTSTNPFTASAISPVDSSGP